MRNETEGAKEARRVIKLFQQCLNSPRLVPEQCYRPASHTYMLVNYVNQITGLFLSKNYHPIPIFLQRANNELGRVNPEKVSDPYRQIVLSYLAQMAYFLVEFDCFDPADETTITFIPSELLALGIQSAPDLSFFPGEF